MIDIEKYLGQLRQTLSASYVSLLLDIAESRGIPAVQLLANTDLNVNDLKDEKRIAIWQHCSVIFNLLKLTNEPSIAIEMGLRNSPVKSSIISFGLMSCESLQDAIELGVRFLPIQFPYFDASLKVDGDVAIIIIKDRVPFLIARRFILENFLIRAAEVLISLLFDQHVSDKYKKLSCELFFDYPEPDHFSAYKDRLPALSFNQAECQIRFSVEALSFTLPTANSEIKQIIVKQGESELEKLNRTQEWVKRVSALLVIKDGQYPDLTSLSKKMNMSESSFKRKLAEGGANYTTLLNEVRLSDAKALLTQFELRIEDISARLGFQDRASFTRAFQRWTSMSPTEYRRMLIKK